VKTTIALTVLLLTQDIRLSPGEYDRQLQQIDRAKRQQQQLDRIEAMQRQQQIQQQMQRQQQQYSRQPDTSIPLQGTTLDLGGSFARGFSLFRQP
jgi:hypothetical protein